MDQPIAQSPKPGEVGQFLMDFPNAIKEVINGKKITRRDWKNPNVYGFLNGGFLTLHKDDGKNYQWLINDGDLLGDDWFTLIEKEQK